MKFPSVKPLVVTLIFLGAGVAMCHAGGPKEATGAKAVAEVVPDPKDDLELLVLRYGKPDEDDSTAYDNPRPPIPSRWVTYRKEHLQAAFIPRGGKVGDPPPYSWRLVGFTDPRTRSVVRPAEAVTRMKARETESWRRWDAARAQRIESTEHNVSGGR